jgi:MFS family permease
MRSSSRKATAGKSTTRVKTFESFAVPAYRVYYASMGATWFAMNILMVVRVLLVYRLSHSAAAAGGLALANAIPTVLVSVLGGSIGDRMEKKDVMLMGRIGLVLLALGVAICLGTGYVSPKNPGSWWVLIITAVFEGALIGLLWPINTSILPELVGLERVMNAIFISQTGMNIFRLIGPALAGYLIDEYSFAVVYYLVTALYALAVVFTIFLPRSGVTSTGAGNAFSDTVQGFSYLGRETAILLVIVFCVCHIISGQPFQQLLPVFTESVLKISASKMGLLMSVSGIGALLGSLVMASLNLRKRGTLLLLSGIVMGIPIMIFTYCHQWWVSLAMMPLIGLGPAMHGGLTSTLVQTYAEPNYRSRMQSFVAMSSGLAGFGTFTAGVLAEAIGIQTSIAMMALFLTLMSALLMVVAPKLRTME